MHKPSLDIESIRALHQAGRLDEAREAYLALLAVDPDNVAALHLLGVLCAEENQLDKAVDYLNRAIQRAPSDPSLPLHLANILKANGQYLEAEKTLQTVIANHPRFAAAFNNLGTLYASRSRWAQAIEAYQAAIDRQPDYADAYYNLGLAYRNAQRQDAAVTTFKALLELSANHPGAYFQLGCLAMRQGQYKEAMDDFSKVAKAHPHHLETQLNMGACCVKLGWLSDAKAHYLQALAISPRETQALFNLGVLSFFVGRDAEGIAYYLQAVKLDPDFFDAHNNLGAAYLMRNDIAAAINHYREAARIRPEHETVRHTLRILTGDKSVSTSPLSYVRDLFDSYAERFDTHLMQSLHYHVPERLLEALRHIKDLTTVPRDIIDLGCGTGLCGVMLRKNMPGGIRTLTGIDISSGMLTQARQKACYDELIEADIESFLGARHAAYDLMLAGDVLVYTGDLSPLFAVARQALRKGGYFVFNAEIHEKTDYELTDSGRFAHSKHYLDQLAGQHYFQIVHYQTTTLRSQNQKDVSGHVYLLRSV